MLETELHDLIDATLPPHGLTRDDGEEYRDPPLDIASFYQRPVRLHWVPVLGQARSVVCLARQPIDIGIAGDGYRRLLERVSSAVHGRYPPWPTGRGLTIGLTLLVMTPEPIRPEDDDALQKALTPSRRSRVVPFGIFRLNLGQEAMAYARNEAPDNLFFEPTLLADVLTERFRRFVPFVSI